MNVTIPDLTGAECGDIAITAAEGGIGYWSVIDSYRPSRWTEGSPYPSDVEDIPDDFVFYTIGSIVDGDEPFEAIDVTPVLIRRGLELIIKHGYSSLLSTAREDWTGEIDSAMADLIIQFGAFGEEVYA